MIIAGLDLGVRKVAMFVMDTETKEMSCEEWEAPAYLSRPEQLKHLSDYVFLSIEYGRVQEVWIEDTLIGNNIKYSLALTEVKGALMCDLVGLIWAGRISRIETVNVGMWKKTVVGRGNATKQEVREFLVGQDARYAEICGDSQDRYDAAAICLCGAIIEERAANPYLLADPGPASGDTGA